MLGKRAEDYVEVIYELSRERGFARVKDISRALSVKPATVSEMLEKLSDKGYVVYRKRERIELTEKGRELAKIVRNRRKTIVKFLTLLGVSRSVAERDACVIEHVLHEETIKRLESFVKFVEKSPANPIWLDHFREFCRTGKHPCRVTEVSQ